MVDLGMLYYTFPLFTRLLIFNAKTLRKMIATIYLVEITVILKESRSLFCVYMYSSTFYKLLTQQKPLYLQTDILN